jgi:NADH dehydrogenase
MVTIGIIGASFAGLRAYNRLHKELPDAKLLLFDKTSSFTYIPSLHLALANPTYLPKIQFDIADYYSGFINEEVKRVQANSVITSQGTYSCDYIVLASGAHTNFFGNKKIQSYAHTAKSAKDIIELWPKIDKAEHITIIGGGLSGIEYATVLAKKYAKKKFCLISGSKQLLPSLPEYNGNKAKTYLERKGVHLELGRYAVDATAQSVSLDNNNKIKTDLIIMCAGIEQKTDICTIKDIDYMRSLPSAKNVFVAGDVCHTDLIPTAHNAMLEGDFVAKCIVAEINGKNKPEPPKNWELLAVALGPRGGTLSNDKHSLSFFATGLAKWFIEQRIMYEFKHHKLWYI